MSDLLTIFAIALGLAMDALAVSIAVGLSLASLTRRHVFRLAWHFGLFQFLMPVLGWFAGHKVEVYIRAVDHWVAFGLLGLIGGKMLWESRHAAGPLHGQRDPTRGWSLVVLSVATSIDALAVGLSMALVQGQAAAGGAAGRGIWLPAVIIGLVAGTLTAFGIRFGGRIGRRWSRWAEVVGGLVLIGIGVKVLLEHGVG